jgi:hypothetical protein
MYYCRIADIEWGPLTAEELNSMATSGKLTPNDLVKKGKEGKWHHASAVKGLFPDKPSSGASPAPRTSSGKRSEAAYKVQSPEAPTRAEPPKPGFKKPSFREGSVVVHQRQEGCALGCLGFVGLWFLLFFLMVRIPDLLGYQWDDDSVLAVFGTLFLVGWPLSVLTGCLTRRRIYSVARHSGDWIFTMESRLFPFARKRKVHLDSASRIVIELDRWGTAVAGAALSLSPLASIRAAKLGRVVRVTLRTSSAEKPFTLLKARERALADVQRISSELSIPVTNRVE